MSIEMNLFNIVILILLSLLIENALRKIEGEKSNRVTRSYWFFLFPSYILAAIFTVILLILQPTYNLEFLLTVQKYALGAHFLSSLLFIAAIDGDRIYKMSEKQKLSEGALK